MVASELFKKWISLQPQSIEKNVRGYTDEDDGIGIDTYSHGINTYVVKYSDFGEKKS